MAKMHLSLRVADLARAGEFYVAFLDATPHKERPGYANFDVADPPLKLALVQSSAASTSRGAGPLDHLGFQLSDAAELEAAKSRLLAAGLATFDEEDAACCYARQDKVWAHDPDGNEWELYVLTDDLADDQAHDHAGNLLAEGAAPVEIQPAHRCREE